MTDEQSPKPASKPRAREYKFPIRHFSNLLEEFLTEEGIDPSATVEELSTAVDKALLHHFKRNG